MAEETEKGFRELRNNYSLHLANAIFQAMQEKGITYGVIIQNIQKEYGEKLNSGTIAGYKAGRVQIPLIFIWEVCKLLEISAEDLFRKAEEGTKKDIPHMCEQCYESTMTATEPRVSLTLPTSPSIITDPSNSVFKGYWGNYSIYFTPTFSSGMGFLKGRMNIFKGTTDVRVKIDLIKHITSGGSQLVEKTYEGVLFYSTAVKCCYCVLTSSAIGEMCFFMFRHFYLNNRNLDCRLAEVLTASAGGEDKTPTVHRMLISREEISDDDISSLLPLLDLNHSQIMISHQALQEIASKNPDYDTIIHCILNLPGIQSDAYYQIRENTIRSAIDGLNKSERAAIFPLIVSMREQAVSSRYNKISKKADEMVRMLLLQKGYFSYKSKS